MKNFVTYHQALPTGGWQLKEKLTPTNTVSYSSPCVNIGSARAAKLVESWQSEAATGEAEEFEKLARDVDESRQSVRKIFDFD